jgi:hypothetical protein
VHCFLSVLFGVLLTLRRESLRRNLQCRNLCLFYATMSILSRNKKVVMESFDHSEEFENKPLLLAGNKRSNAMATPKERQREDAKKFKAPSPPVILRELQQNNKEEVKRGMPPNPVKVPPKSFLSCNSERFGPSPLLKYFRCDIHIFCFIHQNHIHDQTSYIEV